MQQFYDDKLNIDQLEVTLKSDGKKSITENLDLLLSNIRTLKILHCMVLGMNRNSVLSKPNGRTFAFLIGPPPVGSQCQSQQCHENLSCEYSLYGTLRYGTW